MKQSNNRTWRVCAVPTEWRRLICTFLGILLGACGHVPETRSFRYTQAVEFNQRAQSAYQRGEYQTAINFYKRALQLDQSIENVDGIAINLINLAKVHQAMGQLAESNQYLDQLLDNKALEFKREYLAAAAVHKAFLLLKENNVSEANNWTREAIRYCATDCRLNGLIFNLRANIALHGNDADTTLYWGRQGITENKTGNWEQQIEYANSLRLTAQANIMKNEFDTALVSLNEALAVDKKLGLPEKIQLDLALLANVYGAMGQRDLSKQYQDRASSVASVK